MAIKTLYKISYTNKYGTRKIFAEGYSQKKYADWWVKRILNNPDAYDGPRKNPRISKYKSLR